MVNYIKNKLHKEPVMTDRKNAGGAFVSDEVSPKSEGQRTRFREAGIKKKN